MIRKVYKSLAVLLVLVLVVVVSLLAACPAPAPPAEEEAPVPTPVRTIKLGWATDKSGPDPPGIGAQSDACIHYFDQVNAAGGIKGKKGTVKVDVAWVDTAGNVDRAVDAYERWLTDPDFLFYVHCWSSYSLALFDKVERDRIIIHTPALSAINKWPVRRYVYGDATTHIEQFCAVLDYLAENWKEARPLRIAMIRIDFVWSEGAAQFGAKYAKERGVELTGVELVGAAPVDTTVQLRKLAADSPDYIYVLATEPQTTVVTKDAYRIGLDIPLVCNATLDLSSLIKACGAEVTEGMLGAAEFLPTAYMAEEDITPGLEKAEAFWQEHYPGKDIDTECLHNYFKGIKTALVIEEVIRLALDEVAPEDLDADAIIEHGYLRMKDFNPWDICGPITYTPEDHRGCRTVILRQVQNGIVTNVSDWYRGSCVTAEGVLWSKYVEPGTWEEIEAR